MSALYCPVCGSKNILIETDRYCTYTGNKEKKVICPKYKTMSVWEKFKDVWFAQWHTGSFLRNTDRY
jgi:hypothetical protein